MSDDEADPELVELLRQHLRSKLQVNEPAATKVLESAKYIVDNAIDVHLDMRSTKAAAAMIYDQMQTRSYSTSTWSEHGLHPKAKDESTVNFIFLMDLLNFSFWSERSEEDRFSVEYKGRKWTGYWSLVAAIQRALDEGIPITSSDYWQSEDELTEEQMAYIFRSATDEPMPLLKTRLELMRAAGKVLYDKYDCSFLTCIQKANHSAAALVNLLAEDFWVFNDTVKFENRNAVRILKRAQILVADIWAAFDGQGYGEFEDIDKITMFADYRIPQVLHTLGCLQYAPVLEHAVRSKQIIESGHTWEVQIRGKPLQHEVHHDTCY
jgi:hypothetical protein